MTARAALALALHAVTCLQTYAAWASHTGGSTTWTLAYVCGSLITTCGAYTIHADEQQRRARARTAERRARPPDHMPAPDTRRLHHAIHEDRP